MYIYYTVEKRLNRNILDINRNSILQKNIGSAAFFKKNKIVKDIETTLLANIKYIYIERESLKGKIVKVFTAALRHFR